MGVGRCAKEVGMKLELELEVAEHCWPFCETLGVGSSSALSSLHCNVGVGSFTEGWAEECMWTCCNKADRHLKHDIGAGLEMYNCYCSY
jgi:hypothetical protein